MEENTLYKPFAYLEQYTPPEGTTVYYNTEKTLSATKNDCYNEGGGTSVTLTADANKFISTTSIADANEQAESWLSANAQAYANNLGTCGFRETAWRGANPSCVIEPTTTLSPFNYMVVRYKWALGAGRDFDTYTGFINTGIEILDNKWMGWGHGFNNQIPYNSDAGTSYIMWGGDNTQTNGVESCLVNFSKVIEDYSSLNTIQMRMAGSWYGELGSGNIDVEITTYLGGTMSQSGYDIINTGGTQIQQLTFSKKVPKQGQGLSNNIEAVTNIGYITYTKESLTGKIVITY
ncbi:DUF5977 domain-containing protein [Flavobacterium mesophilum]|uniref:DUF5977 domain-containing protein n=1 Tax=Flavobacterium mesophilum TaxID=3143495 RepID=UPI0031D98A0A